MTVLARNEYFFTQVLYEHKFCISTSFVWTHVYPADFCPFLRISLVVEMLMTASLPLYHYVQLLYKSFTHFFLSLLMLLCPIETYPNNKWQRLRSIDVWHKSICSAIAWVQHKSRSHYFPFRWTGRWPKVWNAMRCNSSTRVSVKLYATLLHEPNSETVCNSIAWTQLCALLWCHQTNRLSHKKLFVKHMRKECLIEDYT